MRKLKLQMQITIDGFVAGPNGENDWVFLSQKPDAAAFQFLVDMADSCDTILMGRKLPREFVSHWESVVDNQPGDPWYHFAKRMVDHRKIAFSRTVTTIPGRNLEVENGDLATVVRALKSQSGKDMLVYGGVEFVSSLVSLNLIDEYYFIINPVAIGAGHSIFKDRKILNFESSICYENGKVLIKYLPM